MNLTPKQAIDTLLIRKGESNNVMVFPENDYNSTLFTFADGQYTYTHQAFGAEMFRYSPNFGQNWTQWKEWENTTSIEKSAFADSANFWDGDHIMVQCQIFS